jgi:cell wall-associated NlpC family hydrolase
MKRHAVAISFTPLFSSKNLQEIFQGTTLPLDDGLLRPLETIAFPRTLFSLHSVKDSIAQVSTNDYPSEKPLYTDIRFLSLKKEPIEERRPSLPSAIEMIATMKRCLGMPYLWGGNSWGVGSMLSYYPPGVDTHALSPTVQSIWQLKGVDCSGLLYLAAQGATPRNTSSLVYYGKSVAIEGIPVDQWQIKPLDIIVWPGHVIIALDSTSVIESVKGKGVIITPLKNRVKEIEDTLGRKGYNTIDADNSGKGYVIRRFHPDFL